MHLPKEVKPSYTDITRDTCTLRHIGDLLGWCLLQFACNLKDWFHQLKQHASEYWKSSCNFHDPIRDKLTYLVETVMGMGYVHTSDLARRFGNSAVQIFLKY